MALRAAHFKRLFWLSLGAALAISMAVLGQVYNFFPPPGATYAPGQMQLIHAGGAGTPFGAWLNLGTVATTNGAGEFIQNASSGFSMVANSDPLYTQCPLAGSGALPTHLTGTCMTMTSGSDMGVFGSANLTFNIQSTNIGIGVSTLYNAWNAQTKGTAFGVLDDTTNITCFDSLTPTGPCMFIQSQGAGSSGYPLCFGNSNLVGFGCFGNQRTNFEIQAVLGTTENWAVANVVSATNITTTVGDNTLANSVTNIVATSAANTQANGKPILTGFSGVSGSIGGGALLAGQCSSGTTTVTGATTSMVALADPNTYPGDGTYWDAQVTSANTVTTKVCAVVALTPTASTYNIRVIN